MSTKYKTAFFDAKFQDDEYESKKDNHESKPDSGTDLDLAGTIDGRHFEFDHGSVPEI